MDNDSSHDQNPETMQARPRFFHKRASDTAVLAAFAASINFEGCRSRQDRHLDKFGSASLKFGRSGSKLAKKFAAHRQRVEHERKLLNRKPGNGNQATIQQNTP